MKSRDCAGSIRSAAEIGWAARGFTTKSKDRPFKSRFRKLWGGVAALALAVAIIPAADAAVYTRFDSDDALVNWGIVYRDTSTKNPISIEDGPDGEKALRMTRPGTGGAAGDSAFVYYTGSGDGITSGKVADFEMTSTFSMTFNPTAVGLATPFGLMIRASSKSYSASGGYFFAYMATTSGGSLVLYDSPTSHSAHGTVRDSFDVILNPNVNYVFKISAIGSNISASVWSEDGGTLLGQLEYGNARTNAGYFGVRAGFANTSVAQYVKDVSVSVIPEPATVGFVLMGGAAMLMMLRHRSR